MKQIQHLTLEQVRARYSSKRPVLIEFKTLKQGANIEITNNASDITIAAMGVAQSSHTHNAAESIAGTLATARLGSGTPDSTAFLRGDQTWAVPPSGGSGTARERPVAQWDLSSTKTNIRTAFVDIYTQTNSDGKSVQIDTNGKNSGKTNGILEQDRNWHI